MPLFGEIHNEEMKLNICGKIAKKYWTSITSHFTNIVLHEYIIMPNHIHGIIEFVGARFIAPIDTANPVPAIGTQPAAPDTTAPNQTTDPATTSQGAINRAPTIGGFAEQNNPMLNENLARIIRWYKGRTTFECRKDQSALFAWQNNYHEHIIRNQNDYNAIAEYIKTNPANWKNDRFYHMENNLNKALKQWARFKKNNGMLRTQ
jgi:REP element-mobilizing transposase RayT